MTDIPDDAPIRLKDAIKIAFPCGGMTVSGLRREHANGHLEIEMIAGKQFVTLRAIRKMRECCKQVAPTHAKLPPKSDFAPPKKRTPGVIYACDIPEEIMRNAVQARMQKRRDELRKEIRERKRKEGYRVLGRD